MTDHSAASEGPRAPLECEITGLSADSREIRPGFLFAALPGAKKDGREFIPEALARGAAAILAPPDTRLPASRSGKSAEIPLIIDETPRRRFALMAARFYDTQPATIAAVTGTNGKSSVVRFTAQIWARLGHGAASLGTLGLDRFPPAGKKDADDGPAGGGQKNAPSPTLTTADPVTLHRSLAALADDGIDRLAMEASSHGLAQHRLDGVRVTLAGFTNLSRDHLDYHGTMEAYLAAKLRLFDTLLAPHGVAVVNADDAAAARVIAACGHHRVLTYGRAGHDLRLKRLTPAGQAQHLDLEVMGRPLSATLPLAGAFQAANALCALGLALADGADPAAAGELLAALSPVTGRLQQVPHTRPEIGIYVDYAHTPDALAAALAALRPHCRGRLVVVFGAGGDRDPGKRPLMGEVASRHADAIFVTDDNPRTEDSATIRRQILDACPNAVEIGDRRRAIEAAITSLETGDVLLIAGKGHETYQIIGERSLPFDDAEIARAIATAPMTHTRSS